MWKSTGFSAISRDNIKTSAKDGINHKLKQHKSLFDEVFMSAEWLVCKSMR
jgi:hypothetical protein